MPYNPAQYVRPRTGIRAGAAALGGAIAQIPGEIRADREYEYLQEQRRIAVEEAKKNWSDMELTWKTLKKQYGAMVQPLLDSNQMTFDEYSTNISMIPQPTQVDKKNPGQYIDRLTQAYGSIVKDAKKRIRTQEVAPQVQTAIQGGETPERQVTETTGYQPAAREGAAYVPSKAEGAPAGAYSSEGGQVGGFTKYEPTFGQKTLPPEKEPAARTKEEAYGRLPAGRGITTTEFEEFGGKYLPTGMDIKKQKANEEYKRKMLARGYGKDAVDNALKELDLLRKFRNDDTRVELSLEDDKRMLTSLKSRVQKGDALTPDEIQQLTEQGIDPLTVQQGGEDLAVEIGDIIKDTDGKLGIQRQKSKRTEEAIRLKAENPNADIHEIISETQTTQYPQGAPTIKSPLGVPPAAGGRKQIGRQGTVAGRQGIQTQKPPSAQPIGKMEQAIRDTLSKKGVSPQVIEDYIAEKKAKGQL